MSNGDSTEAAISTPAGSFSIKGKKTAELIAFFCLAALLVLGYVMWEHKADTKETGLALRDAIKEMTEAQKESNGTMREWMCLSTLDPAKREREWLSPNSFCKQMSRVR